MIPSTIKPRFDSIEETEYKKNNKLTAGLINESMWWLDPNNWSITLNGEPDSGYMIRDNREITLKLQDFRLLTPSSLIAIEKDVTSGIYDFFIAPFSVYVGMRRYDYAPIRLRGNVFSLQSPAVVYLDVQIYPPNQVHGFKIDLRPGIARSMVEFKSFYQRQYPISASFLLPIAEVQFEKLSPSEGLILQNDYSDPFTTNKSDWQFVKHHGTTSITVVDALRKVEYTITQTYERKRIVWDDLNNYEQQLGTYLSGDDLVSKSGAVEIDGEIGDGESFYILIEDTITPYAEGSGLFVERQVWRREFVSDKGFNLRARVVKQHQFGHIYLPETLSRYEDQNEEDEESEGNTSSSSTSSSSEDVCCNRNMLDWALYKYPNTWYFKPESGFGDLEDIESTDCDNPELKVLEVTQTWPGGDWDGCLGDFAPPGYFGPYSATWYYLIPADTPRSEYGNWIDIEMQIGCLDQQGRGIRYFDGGFNFSSGVQYLTPECWSGDCTNLNLSGINVNITNILRDQYEWEFTIVDCEGGIVEEESSSSSSTGGTSSSTSSGSSSSSSSTSESSESSSSSSSDSEDDLLPLPVAVDNTTASIFRGPWQLGTYNNNVIILRKGDQEKMFRRNQPTFSRFRVLHGTVNYSTMCAHKLDELGAYDGVYLFEATDVKDADNNDVEFVCTEEVLAPTKEGHGSFYQSQIWIAPTLSSKNPINPDEEE